jgi:hypothetical protein
VAARRPLAGGVPMEYDFSLFQYAGLFVEATAVLDNMDSERERLCAYCGESFSINRDQRRLYVLNWLAGTLKPCPEC